MRAAAGPAPASQPHEGRPDMGAKKRSAAEDVAAKEQREQTAKALERKMDAMRKGAGAQCSALSRYRLPG